MKPGSKAAQGKYEVSLEHLVEPESKDRLRKQGWACHRDTGDNLSASNGEAGPLMIQKASQSWLISVRLALRNNTSEK